MPNPKINIDKSKLDLALEWAGWICLVLAWALIFRGYYKLPETIPLHFDHTGHATRYGSKNNLFILPAMGSILYVAILLLSRYPEKFNYLSKITPENAASEYKTATLVLRITNWVAMAGICYLSYAIAKSAEMKNSAPSPFFFLLFITGLNLPVIILIFRSFFKPAN